MVIYMFCRFYRYFCFILTKLLSQCQANLDISKWMVYIDQKRCNAVAFYKADVVVYT